MLRITASDTFLLKHPNELCETGLNHTINLGNLIQMRVIFICALLVLGAAPAWVTANTSVDDDLVKSSHLSCKLSRDIRRRDPVQSKSAFQYYIDNKAALLAVDDAYLVEGLTAAKVKKFCLRIEGDFQRQGALLIYDKASSACRASHAALEKGQLKQAKQQYVLYKSSLDLASSTSSAAIDLERGSLQWRKCQGLEKKLNEFTTGKVKKVRDRLDKVYARCLPVWSEINTTGQSSLSITQLTSQLSKMKAESWALRARIKKMNTASLNSAMQEFQTCVTQVARALPAQVTQQRLSALNENLQRCQSGPIAEDLQVKAQNLLDEKLTDSVKLTAAQGLSIAAQERALNHCLQSAAPASDPLQLDIELEEDGEIDVIEQMLEEESALENRRQALRNS